MDAHAIGRRQAGRLLVSTTLASALLPCPARAAAAVADWADLAERLTPYANWRSRTIMHLAMHDALNAIRPRYARYMPPGPDEPPAEGAVPEAALAAAAGTVLAVIHPEAGTRIGAAQAAGIATAPEGPGRAAGAALGQAIARAHLAAREGDGATGHMALGTPGMGSFPVSDEPGRWRPAPPLDTLNDTARIAALRPFALAHPAELRPDGPPALDSPEMRRDLEEVRRLGAADSGIRTPEQTEAARVWGRHGTARSWPLVMAPLLLARSGADAWAVARGMALVNIALFDSGVACWDAKAHFLRWRPITALREGGFGLDARPGWTPLLPTPPFPEYLAGHTAISMAVALVAMDLLGATPEGFVFRALPFSGALEPIATLRFANPLAAAEECGESRIWAGVHLRTTNEHSVRQAETVARRILDTQLRPLAATR